MQAHQAQYQKVLSEIGKGLGLRGRIQESQIIAHCIEQIDTIVQKSGSTPRDLKVLLDLVASRLNLSIKEIRSRADLDTLLKLHPPAIEPVFARIPLELDDETDAIVIHRPNRAEWERPYLAVINCMDDHIHRRYFSKWHEIVHILLEGPQMTFSFRRTSKSDRKLPLEQLVDRVAGHLAFYTPMFKPVLDRHVSASKLTFSTIDKIREHVAPEASRHATIIASIKHTAEPLMYARLNLGLKKAEQAILDEPDLFPGTIPPPTYKLRVKDSASNTAAQKMGLQLFQNMSISSDSLAAQVFEQGGSAQASESFKLWRSDGPAAQVTVEATKIGNDVHCLIHAA